MSVAFPLPSTDIERMLPLLLRAALRGESPALVLDELLPILPELMAWCEEQQLIPLVVEGLFFIPGFADTPEASALVARVGGFAVLSAIQTETATRLSDALEAAGIEHMPLKGTLLKALYTYPEWRSMGDVDVLIHPADRERVTAILLAMGAVEGVETDHEYHFISREGVHIELHKSLVPTYDSDLYAYFGDGFTRARTADGWRHRRVMSPEDTYLYHVAHMAKHYRTGGVGVRYAIDLYVLRHAYALDERYLARELSRLHLSVFEDCTRRLSDVWFASGVQDEATQRMSRFLFSGGVYGDGMRSELSKVARLSGEGRLGKRRRRRQIFFPSYAVMRLRGHTGGRWRLPLWWIERWWELWHLRREHCRDKLDGLARLPEESVALLLEELDAVGLSLPNGA